CARGLMDCGGGVCYGTLSGRWIDHVFDFW
nr:immunoglobulin heavy chain junction region [Macaca mulatta]